MPSDQPEGYLRELQRGRKKKERRRKGPDWTSLRPRHIYAVDFQ